MSIKKTKTLPSSDPKIKWNLSTTATRVGTAGNYDAVIVGNPRGTYRWTITRNSDGGKVEARWGSYGEFDSITDAKLAVVKAIKSDMNKT